MSKRFRLIIWSLCVLIIAAQTVVAAFCTIPQPAALAVLQDATRVCGSGRILFSSPVMSLWGLLSRALHMKTLTLALHVLPFVIIPLCYLAYVFLIRALPGAKEQGPFILLLIILLQLFAYQSEAFVPCTLLLGWYTGYAILLHGLFPVLLGLLIRYIQSRKEKEAEPKSFDQTEEDDMKHKYLNVRNLGIALLCFFVLMIGALFVLNRKINNLHDATQNLQQSVSNKGELIEFRGALGSEWKGYLIVGSDGGVSVFFGGDEKDGPALAELISQYTQTVDNWYLNEKEQGAYEYCRDKGVAVSHVYVMQGMEEVQ